MTTAGHTDEARHYWRHCDQCQRATVICGKCGNNSCNAAYGTVNGKECDACPSAYAMQSQGWRTYSKRELRWLCDQPHPMPGKLGRYTYWRADMPETAQDRP